MNAAFQTALPEHLPLAASPQLAENSRLGFRPVASTSRWGFSFSISSHTLGLSGSLYDGRVRSRSTGKERDTESGNDYFVARYYNSTMGRFLIPDWSAKVTPVPYAKLDDPQSLNLYAYMRNNPLGGVDADGHFGNGPDRFGCSEGQKDCNTENQKKPPKQNVKNTDVMLMAKPGPSVGANAKPYQHGTDGTAYMDWQIVPQANNISQLPSDPHAALNGKYDKALIILDESKPGGQGHREGTRTGSGHDSLNPLALPVEQKWYINVGGVNNSSNQRIQLVTGMKPDGTLIKAWTVQVTAGPAYKKED